MTQSRLGPVSLFHILAIVFLVVLAGVWCGDDSARAEEVPPGFSQAEEYVLEQVAAGKVANLKVHFPDESDRVLSTAFLEQLLTGGLKDVTVHRLGVRIQYAVFTNPLNLRNAEVAHETWLDNCHFNDKVDLSNSRFGRHLSFDGSQFNHAKAGANFNGMKVDGIASFRKAVFAGPVNFVRAEISSQFDADGAEFKNTKAGTDFRDMKVGDIAFFRKAVFAGPVKFLGAEITGQFIADGAEFKNTKAGANFNGMKVRVAAFFRKAVFAGPVNFIGAEITGQFIANGAEFKNTKAGANFDGMKVGGIAFFREAVFAGPVRFRGAEITSNFEADGAQFNNAMAEANFDSMKVGGIAFFRNGVFKGPLSIADAELLDLVIEGPQQSGPTLLKHLDLSRTVIQRELRIQNVRLGEIVAPSLQVAGPATLTRVTIEQVTNLEYARFLTLSLREVSWPSESDSVRLEGMTYEHISAGEGKDSWKKLLAWIDHSAYSTQPYSQLEASFRADGYPERADAVYVALKQRERREVFAFSSLGWWKNVLLEKLVRYGRSAHWALYWSALVVFIGVLVFARRKDVEPRKAEDTSRPYNPLWYSLDLFLPFVPLQAAEVWMPRQDSRFRRHYAGLHTILGWLLIPIGLAAITGIIR